MKYELIEHYLYIDISSLYVKTIQEFLDAYIPSRKIQHLLIQNTWITIDHRQVRRDSLLDGDKLIINIYPKAHYYTQGNKGFVDIVYEDELFVILNKPSGILVHSDGSSDETLTKLLEKHYARINDYVEVKPLHRLDKETSGLLVFSKSYIFQPLLDALMFQKRIRRTYLAFTKGKASINQSYEIKHKIGRDRHNPKRQIITKNGQQAHTKAKSLGFSNKGYSIFKCTLKTGRTHQIRLHLASIGFPILNDEIYGIKSDLLNRMGLVAYRLEFYHPLKEELISLELELPDDLKKLYAEVMLENNK